jgi:hypothetical protein
MRSLPDVTSVLLDDVWRASEFWSENLFLLFKVMGSTMMVGKVVSLVVGVRPPVVFELFLGFSTAKPVKPHVHGICALWLDVVVDDSQCSAVVGLNWSLGLFVTYLGEELVHGYCFLGIDVKGA